MGIPRPISDRIIVKRDPAITKSPGGIELLEQFQPRPRRGTVVAVGPGLVDKNGNFAPPDIKVNDRVIFGRYAGVEITVDDENYSIMRASDVDLVFEGSGEDIEPQGDRKRTGGVHPYYAK